MKSVIALLATSLLLAASGCAAGDANMSTVEYPPPPVGYDAPLQSPPEGVAASEPGALRPQAVAAQGDQEFSPQQGDIAIGVDQSEGYADTDPAALADFRQPLEPYGTWAEDGQYGTVWTPSTSVVGSDFAPYVTAGHWTYDRDYTWVSDYDWGWAPYHYGRWVYIGQRGWSWIPGRTYAGAWVTWRTGYDDWGYVGWAPLPPTWYWRGGYAVGVGFVPAAPYVFCSTSHLFQPGIGGHVVTGTQVGVVASHTRPYVPANPGIGLPGHVGAHPSIGGPPPHQLGLAVASVPHAPTDNRGLQRAQQFSTPQTAQTLGARPPQHYAQPAQTSRAFAAQQVSPGSPRMSSSMTLGRNAPVVSSPQYHGVQPTPYRAPTYSAPAYSAHSSPTTTPTPYYGGHTAASAPTYRSSPSAPVFHSAPSAPSYRPSAPSYSAPSAHSYSAPSAPSHGYSAPSAPSHSYSAPSFSRPSGGGGGGFRGGGGAVRGGRR